MDSTIIYELRKEGGDTLYRGDDRAKVQRLIARQRIGEKGRPKFLLIVDSPAERAVHALRERDGSVQVEHTMIRRFVGRSVHEILACPELSTPPTSTSRTVWERLRDPWPATE